MQASVQCRACARPMCGVQVALFSGSLGWERREEIIVVTTPGAGQRMRKRERKKEKKVVELRRDFVISMTYKQKQPGGLATWT